LSVASKGAALALLLRVALGIGWVAPAGHEPGARSGARSRSALTSTSPTQTPAALPLATAPSRDDRLPVALAAHRQGSGQRTGVTRKNEQLQQLRSFTARLVALLAVVTCTFGNLAAYGQSNIKRMLAYSTIAHAGYMMMAVPPVLELVGHGSDYAAQAAASLLIYIAVYVFLNLGAFVVVAFMRDHISSEQIEDYTGLLRCSPGMAICFSIILFGLVGLPPLSGFLGKFAVFAALTDAFRASGEGYLMVLLVAGGINTALSLFYYLRVVRLMTMFSLPTGGSAMAIRLISPRGLFVLVLTVPTALWILQWQSLAAIAIAAAESLFA
jgi:NADH-quinone oxidoreductase subunit N